MKKRKEKKAKASKGLIALLGKSLTDEELRERLFTDTKGVAKDFKLSDEDVEAVKKMDRKELEDTASRMAGRADLTIKVVISKSF